MESTPSAARPLHSVLRREGVHVLRLLVIVGILSLIHVQAAKISQQAMLEQQSKAWAQTDFAQLIPFPVDWGDFQTLTFAGGTDTKNPVQVVRSIVNREQETVGYGLQTSPVGDASIGFSGPTNVLLIFDHEDRLLSWNIIWSRDTPEHVALIQKDRKYLSHLLGRTRQEINSGTGSKQPVYDAVSGATLTSRAMLDAIRLSTGGKLIGSSRFPEAVTLVDVQKLFPAAKEFEMNQAFSSLFQVYDEGKNLLGTILRTSPTTDQLIGYQGPSDLWIAIDPAGKVVNYQLQQTFDNTPYVDYVRKDSYFHEYLSGKTVTEIAAMDPDKTEYEGVSGATMTSQTAMQGIVLAIIKYQSVRDNSSQTAALPAFQLTTQIQWKDIVALVVVLFATIISLTHLRGIKWLRIAMRVVVIIYLGFIWGGLLSQAMWVGWARHGIPWSSALGLIGMSIIAIVIPLGFKHNVYCHQICPHGALQQLIKPKKSRFNHSSVWVKRMLQVMRYIPAILLVVVVLVSMLQLPFSLVNLEPFDAYIYEAAGIASITIFVVSLVLSWFEPMAYCRFGCPTGALLDHVRRHKQTGNWTPADWLATACLIMSLGIWWWT
jgi:Na+-translocating ferredoxin:NAD+ oxidoreductase RnfG subunit